MQHKKYKNQAGINPTLPSQNCHVVRWHCTAESKWRVAEIKKTNFSVITIIIQLICYGISQQVHIWKMEILE